MDFQLAAQPSPLLFWGFITLSFAMVGLWAAFAFASGGRRAAIIMTLGWLAWMTTTGLAAHRGLLSDFSRFPPPVAFMLVPMLVLVAVVAASPLGARLARLPLAWLVGLHVFRLPVELLIHRAVGEGVAPELMTWSGRNFDIITPIAAVVFGFLIHKGTSPRGLAFAFNLLGLALLANVVTTAILAMPTSFQQLIAEPPNVWVAHFPFVWLPAVLVSSALLGHLLIGRALRNR